MFTVVVLHKLILDDESLLNMVVAIGGEDKVVVPVPLVVRLPQLIFCDLNW